MGTFHVFVPEFSPLIEKAEKLISKCSHYYGEMDLTQVDPLIINETMQSLPRPGKEVLYLLENQQPYFEKMGLPFPAYPAQNSIFNLYSELTMSMWRKKILVGSLDEELIKIAMKNHIPIGGIESFNDQLEIMKSIDYEKMEKQIIKMLIKPKSFSKNMDHLLDFYLKGKMNVLSKKSKGSSRGNRKLMVKDRNRVFADTIARICEESDRNFISFGAGHLGGKDGVIRRLKKPVLKSEKSVLINHLLPVTLISI